MPFRAQLDLQLSPFGGIQNIMYFFNSEDLRDFAYFLYCNNTDNIIHICPKFSCFLEQHKINMDSGYILGFDLFAIDLAEIITKGDRKVHDKIGCSLVKPRGASAAPLKLNIMEVFSVHGKSISLLQVESDCFVDEHQTIPSKLVVEIQTNVNINKRMNLSE